MGTKHKKDVIEHLKTQLVVNQCNTCENCPLKIYAKENEKITFGVGNINSDIIIVLPTYDVKADKNYTTILKLLIDTYKEHTGKDILEDAYITRIVKCHDKSQYQLINQASYNCIFFVAYEIVKIKAKYILFLGSMEMFNDAIENTQLNPLIDRTYYTFYSPAILYYDNKKIKDNFINQLKFISTL